MYQDTRISVGVNLSLFIKIT